MTISDGAALHAVTSLRPSSRGLFEVVEARLHGDELDLGIRGRSGAAARVRVALPRTERDQFWIYVEPEDADDWASQLFLWIEEEVQTGGLSSSRVRTEIGGESYVLVELYGWRLADRGEHERLVEALGPTRDA